MPGIVPVEVIELSGFCIGCAEKPDLIDPTTVAIGDVLIGYASDSIHANGWSLVRRVLHEFPGEVTQAELGEWLKPTRLYHDVTRDLKAAGVKYERFLYAGTQHGFNNNTTPRFDASAAKLAWERTVAFFRQHVR